MEPLGVALLIASYAAVIGLGVWAALTDERQRRQQAIESERDSVVRAFHVAARRMGLQLVRDRKLYGRRLGGLIDGSRVTAQCASHARGPWLTTISIEPQPPLPSDVWLQSHWRTSASRAQHTVVSRESDFETGDAAFDALFVVGGRAAAARVLLVEAGRRALVVLARRGALHLDEGRLTYETLERIWNASQLIALVRETLATARALPRVSDVPAALADIASGRDLPGVRARCLTTLLAEHAQHARTGPTLEAALADTSDAVRVIAAAALGERGVATLREIALGKDREEQPAARAIGLLGRRLSSAELAALLDSAMDARRDTVALAAIESLGRADDANACARLTAVLQGSDETLAAAAATALGATSSAAAEELLVAALTKPSLHLRHAAVRALGRIGSLATMTRLTALLQDDTVGPTLITAAQQAIAAIQARLPGAAPGQVSLAETASGELSLAEGGASGRLSLPRDRPAK